MEYVKFIRWKHYCILGYLYVSIVSICTHIMHVAHGALTTFFMHASWWCNSVYAFYACYACHAYNLVYRCNSVYACDSCYSTLFTLVAQFTCVGILFLILHKHWNCWRILRRQENLEVCYAMRNTQDLRRLYAVYVGCVNYIYIYIYIYILIRHSRRYIWGSLILWREDEDCPHQTWKKRANCW